MVSVDVKYHVYLLLAEHARSTLVMSVFWNVHDVNLPLRVKSVVLYRNTETDHAKTFHAAATLSHTVTAKMLQLLPQRQSPLVLQGEPCII